MSDPQPVFDPSMITARNPAPAPDAKAVAVAIRRLRDGGTFPHLRADTWELTRTPDGIRPTRVPADTTPGTDSAVTAMALAMFGPDVRKVTVWRDGPDRDW